MVRTVLIVYALLGSVMAQAGEFVRHLGYYGAVLETGVYGAASDRWRAGDTYYGVESRAYFGALLGGLEGQTVVGATLRLWIPANDPSHCCLTIYDGFNSPDGTETLALFEYAGDQALITGKSSGADVFADLGTGTGFGSVVLDSSANGNWVEINLNEAGIAAIQAVIDDPDNHNIFFGGRLTTVDTMDNDPEFVEADYWVNDAEGRFPEPELVLHLDNSPAPAGNGAIRIDFEGTFGNSNWGATPRGALVGQPFIGRIMIPATGMARLSDGIDSAAYAMDFPAAYFSFDAVDDAFDIDRAGGARLIVMHCSATQAMPSGIADDCYFERDTIIIYLLDESRDLYAELSFGVDNFQPMWLTDGAVPTLDQFRNPTAYPAFSLCNSEWSDCVDTYTNSYPDTDLTTIDISWVPAVSMDFAPGDETNGVDPAEDTTLLVAIQSTSVADGDDTDFDATTVNAMSLRLGTLEAPNRTWPVFSDVDGDSDTDTVFSFNAADTGITCDDTDVYLSGETQAGQAFFATDAITALNCDGGCHP